MDFSAFSDNHVIGNILFSFIGLFIVMFLIKFINRAMYSAIKENQKYYMARKRVYYLFSTVYVVYFIYIWSNSNANLSTYFGLLSAGIAIALKDLFTNIAAWLFIVIRKPFEVSDRIAIGESCGDVIDIRMFQFTLMEVSSYEKGEQSTGRIVNIPNYYVFINSLTNFNKGFKFVWNEISVLITFESDWKKAKKILTDIANKNSLHLTDEAEKMLRQASKKYMIHYSKLTPIVYTNVKESGVELTIRYLTGPRQRRVSADKIWENILIEFEKNPNINLAYPTIRVTDK
jgi:small-conductance mechanosensitive channel